jgi:hypothetical protein
MPSGADLIVVSPRRLGGGACRFRHLSAHEETLQGTLGVSAVMLAGALALGLVQKHVFWTLFLFPWLPVPSLRSI